MKILTEAQRQAVTTEATNTLVTAPAGSGKTEVIVQRIKWLVEERGQDPKDIALVTYTNEAARAATERVGQALGYAGTLHGFCLRAIRAGMDGAEDWRVIDDTELAAQLLRAADETCQKKPSVNRLAKIHADWLGGEMNTPDKLTIARYRQNALREGLVDYDSLLALALGLLSDGRTGLPYGHLIVDEWQDASPIDWEIYKATPAESRFFVGDPMQAIFGFRGGGTGKPEATWGWQAFELHENFRSTPEICAAATRLAQGRLLKAARPCLTTPPPVRCHSFGNDAMEAIAIAASLGDPAEAARTAVLCRTNAIAGGILDVLREHGVPTRHLEEVKRPDDWALAMATLGWLARPNSTRAFQRFGTASGLMVPATTARLVTFRPITGDADKLNEEMEALGVSRESAFLIDERFTEMPETASLLDLEASLTLDSHRAVQGEAEGAFIGTIHSAKGREFDRVILAGFEDEIIPGNGKRTDLAEERRVAYVGATRAREELIFTWAKSRRVNYGLRHPEPHTASRFLKETLP